MTKRNKINNFLINISKKHFYPKLKKFIQQDY